MLLKMGAVLLVVWLVTVLLPEELGNIRHVPQFLGLRLVIAHMLPATASADMLRA